MNSRNAAKSCIASFALILVFAKFILADQGPSWWYERDVINSQQYTNDFAPINQGQLKWITVNAYLEFSNVFSSDGLSNILCIVNSFSDKNNYYPVNAGQLKATVKPFYDCLIKYGVVAAYPWSNSGVNDFAPVNVGQLKYVYSFSITNILSLDSDSDGLPNLWEVKYSLNPTVSNNTLVDFDQDGLVLSEEYWHGTSPNTNDTDNDSIPDGWEVTYCLDPVFAGDASQDPDCDGTTSSNEFVQSTNPKKFYSVNHIDTIYIRGDFNCWNFDKNMILTNNNVWTAYITLTSGLNRIVLEVYDLINPPDWDISVEAGWSLLSNTNILVPSSVTQNIAYSCAGLPATNSIQINTTGVYKIEVCEVSSNLIIEGTCQIPNDFGELCSLYNLADDFVGGYPYWKFSNTFHRSSSSCYSTIFGLFKGEPLTPYKPYEFFILETDPWGIYWADTNQAGSLPNFTSYASKIVPGKNYSESISMNASNSIYRITFEPKSGFYKIEIVSSTNDFDNDMLSDYQELFLNNTDPYSCDSDRDGIDDGQEIANGSNPNSILPKSGLNSNWIYHGNLSYANPCSELVPGECLFSQRFLTGPRSNRFSFFVIAPTNLALGSDEFAELKLRIDNEGDSIWIEETKQTNIFLSYTNSFHETPTLGSGYILNVHRFDWSQSSTNSLRYCPYIKILNANSQILNEIYLYPDSTSGVTFTNNWYEHGQHFSSSFMPSNAYEFKPYHYSDGTNVVILYNSNWTHDSNNNGVQDSLEIAQYYQKARSVPADQVLGVTPDFNTPSIPGSITCSNFYHTILTNMHACINSLEHDIYYIAVCYGIPVFLTPESQALDGYLINLSDSVARYTGSGFEDPQSVQSPFWYSSSNPHHAIHMSELRTIICPTNDSLYLPSRIDGPTVEIAKGLVDKALYAEQYMIDGGGPTNHNFHCITVADDLYYEARGKQILWKEEQYEVASDVKNLFAGMKMSKYESPFSSSNSDLLSPWYVIHDNQDNLIGYSNLKPMVHAIVASNNTLENQLFLSSSLTNTDASVRDESYTWYGYENYYITNTSGNSAKIVHVFSNKVVELDRSSQFSAGQVIYLVQDTYFPLSNVAWHCSYYQPGCYYDVIQWAVGSVSFQQESFTLRNFRDIDAADYGNRALSRGVTAIAGPIVEPGYNCVPNADMIFNSLAMGFQWAEAAIQSYYPYFHDRNITVGDPLYAPFRTLWERSVLIDTNSPVIISVTNNTFGCMGDEINITAELSTNTYEQSIDLALFQIKYGTNTLTMTNSIDFVFWPEPESSSYRFDRRYWYGRRCAEKLTNLITGISYYYVIAAKDPYGNVGYSKTNVFVR